MNILTGHLLFQSIPNITTHCYPEALELEIEEPTLDIEIEQPELELTIEEPVICQL